MSNKKITQLPELFDPALVDEITIIDTSEANATLRNKKISLSTLNDFFGGGPAIQTRTPLTEDTNYFVSSVSGSDSNTGSSPTQAWRTLEKAFQVIQQDIDAAGYTIRIILGEGSYIPQGGSFHIPSIVGANPDSCDTPAAPTAPIINAPLQIFGEDEFTVIIHGLELDHESYVGLQDLTLRPVLSGGTNRCLRVSRQGTVELHNITLSASTSSATAIETRDGGQVILRNQITAVSNGGNFSSFFNVRTKSAIFADELGYGTLTFLPGLIINLLADIDNGELLLRSSNFTFDNVSQINKVAIRNGVLTVPSSIQSLITSINPSVTSNPSNGYFYGYLNNIPINDTFVKAEGAVPTFNTADGAIRIDNVNDVLYFRSGGSWVQAGGGGGGGDEPYVEINSTGSLPVVSSTDSIAIGVNSNISTSSANAIAIGPSAKVGSNDPRAISIGNNPSAFSADSIAIGTDAVASGGSDTIAFGARNSITSVGCFSFGTDNVINNGTTNVHTNTSSCIAIGDDNTINDCSQTFLLGDQNTAIGLNDALIIGEDNVMTGGVSLTAGQSNMFNNIQLGHQNSIIDTTNDSNIGNRIQIGLQHTNNGISSYQTIQIGSNTTIGNNSEFGIAIGTDAVIGDSSPGAVQIGIGTNSETNTLKFRSTKIADFAGIMVPLHNGAPTAIVDDGHIRIDSTNDALYFRSGGSWVQAGGSSGSGEPYVEINSTGGFPTANGIDSIAIGENSSVFDTDGIALGRGAQIGDGDTLIATDSIAIGRFSRTAGNNDSVGAIAIGLSAQGDANSAIAIGNGANVDADNAIQLGTGTNNAANTLQYLGNRLANAEGLYTSFTAPSNYTPADNDNVTSHLQAIDTALASAGGGGGDPDELVFKATQSAGFTVADADHGTNIPVDSTITITLPDDTVLTKNVEFNVDLDTANQIITYSPSGSATIVSSSTTQSVQHTTVNCRFNRSLNTWILRGGLT